MISIRTRPDLALRGEHEELRSTVRRFLTATSPPGALRGAIEGPDGFDRSNWSEMANQLGLQSLLVPERYEGLGQGPVEAYVVFEEMGRALYPGPYFSSVALATNALLCSGDEAACEEWLPGIAAGSTIATVAVAEADGRWDEGRATRVLARRDGEGWVLEGT
jgi:alkylation response protein AidB-like acyl-CoA dehydrogenase